MAPDAEPAVLHEYRHLLRTAPTDWQETAHRHALTALGPRVRGQVLVAIHDLLLTGTRLRPDDVADLARLLVLAERRRPRILLDGLHPALLRVLAAAVVRSPVGRTLRVGVEVWDGTDPEPAVATDVVEVRAEAWSGEWGTRVVGCDLGSTAIPTRTHRR